MQAVFLGSGTSNGVPVIGCDCTICTSSNPRDCRTRPSLWIRDTALSILIDIGPEFRVQAIREGMNRLDMILITHPHADHLHGLDDIRPLCKEKTIPVYGNHATIDELKSRFPYIFKTTQKGGGKPKVECRCAAPLEPFTYPFVEQSPGENSISITPIPLKHGLMDILGFRIGNLAYLTDCSEIPEISYGYLQDLEVLIIDGLRPRPHPTHFSINEAIGEAKKIGAVRTVLTHFCHDNSHAEMERVFPEKIEPAYDGLVVDFN